MIVLVLAKHYRRNLAQTAQMRRYLYQTSEILTLEAQGIPWQKAA
jgi:hypothetical protein